MLGTTGSVDTVFPTCLQTVIRAITFAIVAEATCTEGTVVPARPTIGLVRVEIDASRTAVCLTSRALGVDTLRIATNAGCTRVVATATVIGIGGRVYAPFAAVNLVFVAIGVTIKEF
jgi:hypothetical protein